MGGLQTVWGVACLMLEGCCLSLGSNNEMRMCLKVHLGPRRPLTPPALHSRLACLHT